MKKCLTIALLALFILFICGCSHNSDTAQIIATTLPVYEFTQILCQGTDITVTQLITENISCLHDYTLSVSQMRAIESAKIMILSGAGLEDFLLDMPEIPDTIIDASANISLLCAEDAHLHEHGHTHEYDPHIWLSPANATKMAQNICKGLIQHFPQHADKLSDNMISLSKKLTDLEKYGKDCLSDLSCNELITFHDGFSYMANAFELTILHAIEEESGSEASASEIIEIIDLINAHSVKAIFTEANGSTAAASIIATETGIKCYSLDMAISGYSYFDLMYQNIDTLKEALK